MLYLEDYLELIEHLPQELRDRLTYIRESDLKVNNSSSQLETTVERFFAEAKRLTPEQRQCEYEEILKNYDKTMRFADEKVQIATQTRDIMVKLTQKLDTELEKFKLELEADHAGITEELERRSLELDADTRLDSIINGHLSTAHNQQNSIASTSSLSTHQLNQYNRPSGTADGRRSEHKHRHHPYQQSANGYKNNDNGYQGRAKLSQNHHDHTKKLHHHHQHHRHTSKYAQNKIIQSRRNSAASSPAPYGNSLYSSSAPPSVAGDLNGLDSNGHYGSNLSTYVNDPGFKNLYCNNKDNLPYNQQHSALSAALSSATPQTLNSVSALAMMNASSVQNKISTTNGFNGSDLTDPSNPLVRQNPLAAAASQAIAATQQLQQGRRTPSLKASFAAINAAGIGSTLDALGSSNKIASGANSANRNALAPMSDQQTFRYNQYGKTNAGDNTSPLYISVTKSGRPSKRPKHHASHLYPDESPTSISSDNSVFENSESLSSTDYIEIGTNFDSASPSSLEFSDAPRAGQGNTALYHRDETKYCICRQVSYGEMVACDNEECEIEWFHYDCVGITQPPKGKWFCPDCSRKMNSHPQSGHAHSQVQKKRGKKEKTLFHLMA